MRRNIKSSPGGGVRAPGLFKYRTQIVWDICDVSL